MKNNFSDTHTHKKNQRYNIYLFSSAFSFKKVFEMLLYTIDTGKDLKILIKLKIL